MIAQIKDNIQGVLSESLFGRKGFSINELRSKAAPLGITSLDLPRNMNPTAVRLEDMAEIFAFCGEIDLDLRDLPGLGHSRIIIHSKNINEKQLELLGRSCEGLEFFAVAITEPQGGSDIHGIQTTATPSEGGYLITGHKKYVARLAQATQVIVFAKVVDTSVYGQLAAFIIPIDDPTMKIEELHPLGLKGVSLGSISLKNTFVPSELCIDTPISGFSLFNEHFTYWRSAMAASALGCARGAIRQSITWLTERDAFGNTIGRFTHLQQELSRHVARLRMGWALVKSTMNLIDQGRSAYIQAAMTKAEAVEIAIDSVEWAMQIHGAKGYTTEVDLEKRLRDLLGLRIADGATDVLRGQVARGLLGDALYEQSLGRVRENSKAHPLLIEDLLYN